MPTEPAQVALAAFELCLFFSGVGLLLWLLGSPEARSRWLHTNALPPKPVPLPDFLFGAVLVVMTGFAFQAIAQIWLGGAIADAADQPGLALIAYSVASYLGALVAWRVMLPSLRRSWLIDPPAPSAPPPVLPWPHALRFGTGALMVALPVLSLVSVGWAFIIDWLDLPAAPQDVIAIFANTRSPVVVAGMLLVACVLAPIYEELLFRAGLYRFCRQRLGRGWALVISGCSFGVLHGNWAGFLPLAVLGMGLALAYEATGSIRVAIITHGLFNLNTVLVLLSGLPEAVK